MHLGPSVGKENVQANKVAGETGLEEKGGWVGRWKCKKSLGKRYLFQNEAGQKSWC